MALSINISRVAAFLIFVSILSNSIATVIARDFFLGKCKPGKESCRDCYVELVMSLFEGDGNMFNLSQAFSPQTTEAPDLVIVEYHFKNETMDSTEHWFWATSGLNFFYSMNIFQFISLFFGKPTLLNFYEQNLKVVVTLNASDCYGVSTDHMAMLTQRLKAYIQEPNANLKLDDSYRNVAVNKEMLEDLLNNRTKINLVRVFVLGLISLIVIIMLTLYVCAGKLEKRPKPSRQHKSMILSITLISYSRLTFFILLDGFAIYVRDYTLQSDLNEIFYAGDYHHRFYQVPEILLILDTLSFFGFIMLVITALKKKGVYQETDGCQPLLKPVAGGNTMNDKQQPVAGGNTTENETWKKDQHYYFLELTVSCLLFSIFLHFPYIMTAFENDAQHAGSIFIIYATLTMVEFGLLQFSFNRCLEADDDQENEGSSETRKKITKYCGVFSAFTTQFLLYGLTVVIMLYLYFVPTNDSISSVPNQTITVSYQTAIAFVVVYIAYTSIFKKKSSLPIAALRGAHDNWKSFTDQEVITEFYKEMIAKSNEITEKQKEIALQSKITILWRKYDHESEISKKTEIQEEITKLEAEIKGKDGDKSRDSAGDNESILESKLNTTGQKSAKKNTVLRSTHQQLEAWQYMCSYCREILCFHMILIIATMLLSMLLHFKSSVAEHQLQMNIATNPIPVLDAQFIYFETWTLNDSKFNQTINLKRFGFKLHFLPNTSLEPVTFTIGVITSPPDFIPPANTTLVSALYYIETSSELLQPVIVEIEHCINTGWVDSAQLTFAKVHMDINSSPPYVFSKISGGKFDRESWGTMKLSTFSPVGLFAEGENSSIDYLAHLLSSHRKGGPGTYQVALIASLSLHAYKEVVKNGYSEWVPIINNPISFVFNNGSMSLTLSIGKEGIQSGNWEIKPIVIPPEIKRTAIHQYGLASYELKVSWTNKEKEQVPLEYFMDVQGVSWESFMIFIDPDEKGTLTSIFSDGRHCIQASGKVVLKCTKIKDFNRLYQDVANIGDWIGLCSNLGVNEAKMNELRHSSGENEKKKRECLQVYFDTGEAYWEEVVRALIDHPINNKRLARKFVDKYQLKGELLAVSFVCN